MVDISAMCLPPWSIGDAVAALVVFLGIAAFWHLWHSRGSKMKAMRSDMKTQAALRDTESSAPAAESSRDDSRPVTWSPREDTEHSKPTH